MGGPVRRPSIGKRFYLVFLSYEMSYAAALFKFSPYLSGN